jgi:hypothetical protein
LDKRRSPGKIAMPREIVSQPPAIMLISYVFNVATSAPAAAAAGLAADRRSRAYIRKYSKPIAGAKYKMRSITEYESPLAARAPSS